MSNLKIEERFIIEAPVERVFRFLLDPAAVASCLPGARLDGKEGDATFLGTMKVKVGPVATEFKGRATMSEINEAEHSLRLEGTGDDKTGGGSAKMTMRGRVVASASGGSEVSIDAEVEIAGKLVRFGRGMIEGVSKQLFKQFVERLREKIGSAPAESPPPPAAEAAASPAESPAAAAASPVAAEPIAAPPPVAAESVAPTAPPPVAAESVAPAAPPPVAAEPPVPAPVASIAAPTSPVASSAAPASSSVSPKPPVVAVVPAAAASAKSLAKKPDEDEALDAGALVFRVLWDWVKGLFRRLFGRR